MLINAVLEPLRGLSFTLRQELLQNTTGDNVLYKNWYLLGEKKIANHARKTGSWYLLGVLSKISDHYPVFFYMGVPPVPSLPF